MRSLHVLLVIDFVLFLYSCSPKVTSVLDKKYPPLDYRQEVMVWGLNQVEPDSCEFLGQVKVGSTGFNSNCGYEVVVEKAKLEARKIGGNAIKIVEHQLPSPMGSPCHKITARILRLDVKSEVEKPADYATLNIYRYSGYGVLINYDLYLGDSIICRVKNKFKTTIRIKKEGFNTLWAQTETKTEVPIDIKKGRTYYLRCGIEEGEFIGNPKLELVDNLTAISEIESFKAKNQ